MAQQVSVLVTLTGKMHAKLGLPWLEVAIWMGVLVHVCSVATETYSPLSQRVTLCEILRSVLEAGSMLHSANGHFSELSLFHGIYLYNQCGLLKPKDESWPASSSYHNTNPHTSCSSNFVFLLVLLLLLSCKLIVTLAQPANEAHTYLLMVNQKTTRANLQDVGGYRSVCKGVFLHPQLLANIYCQEI